MTLGIRHKTKNCILLITIFYFLFSISFSYAQDRPQSQITPPTQTNINLAPTPGTANEQPEPSVPKAGFRLLGEGNQTGGGSRIIKLPNPLGTASTFPELINRIVNWLLVISAPILVLMIIIGAFQILTAGENPENAIKGRHTITYAIIGYALLLLSSGITSIIENFLSGR